MRGVRAPGVMGLRPGLMARHTRYPSHTRHIPGSEDMDPAYKFPGFGPNVSIRVQFSRSWWAPNACGRMGRRAVTSATVPDSMTGVPLLSPSYGIEPPGQFWTSTTTPRTDRYVAFPSSSIWGGKVATNLNLSIPTSGMGLTNSPRVYLFSTVTTGLTGTTPAAGYLMYLSGAAGKLGSEWYVDAAGVFYLRNSAGTQSLTGGTVVSGTPTTHTICTAWDTAYTHAAIVIDGVSSWATATGITENVDDTANVTSLFTPGAGTATTNVWAHWHHFGSAIYDPGGGIGNLFPFLFMAQGYHRYMQTILPGMGLAVI